MASPVTNPTDHGPHRTATSPLTALAAPCALLAGALLVLTQFIQLALLDRDDKAAMFDNPVYVANGVVQFGVFALMLVAAVATYDVFARRAGAFGVVGVVAVMVGVLNLGGNYWFEAFVSPWAATNLRGYFETPPSGTLPLGGLSSYLLFAIGWMLFGLSAWRSRELPPSVCAALVAGGVVAVQMVQPPLGVPLGIALVWLGTWLLRTDASDR